MYTILKNDGGTGASGLNTILNEQVEYIDKEIIRIEQYKAAVEVRENGDGDNSLPLFIPGDRVMGMW